MNFPKHHDNAKKGDNGRLLIVSGNHHYTGSSIFASMGAYGVGVDIVNVLTCKRSADIASSYAPEIITLSYHDFYLKKHYLEGLRKNYYSAALIGPGLGREPETEKAVIQFIKNHTIPIVIDADAISLLKDHKHLLKGKNILMTPNSNEFEHFTGRISENIDERKKQVQELARELGIVVLLKGPVDIISDGNSVHINETGAGVMAKGGFGDLLAGICAGLISRKVDLYDAAVMGVWINCKAGELAAREKYESTLPTDAMAMIPKALKTLKARK